MKTSVFVNWFLTGTPFATEASQEHAENLKTTRSTDVNQDTDLDPASDEWKFIHANTTLYSSELAWKKAKYLHGVLSAEADRCFNVSVWLYTLHIHSQRVCVKLTVFINILQLAEHRQHMLFKQMTVVLSFA